MEVPRIVIAIDGYSSTGKSTLAKQIASELSFLYLDSGALYRGVTLFAQENGMIDMANRIDEPALKAALPSLDLHFEFTALGTQTYMNGECVEGLIRSLKVSNQVSPVSAIPFVRNFVDDKLHEFGAKGGVVMDGRDIGTTVFPDAGIKIFLTASEQIRATRRYEEMLMKGETPSFDDVLQNLRERDYIDSHRETSPLQRAADAFLLDNTNLTPGEELAWVKGLIQGKYSVIE